MRPRLNFLILCSEKILALMRNDQIPPRFTVPKVKRRVLIMRKYRFFIFLFMLGAWVLGQEVTYDNFEGNKVVTYSEKSGVLDTLAANPAIDKVNGSPQCALYIRNSSKKFDNIKMKLASNLVDVSAYATHEGNPPKLKMKIYTTAPPGTLVEILLGSKRSNDYPAGTNSQYQAYTTVSNAWEELNFTFSQIPMGSETSTTQVDQVVLLFNPNSSTSDKYYFDDITGPALVQWPPQQIAKPEKEKVSGKTKEVQKVKTTKKVTKRTN